MRLQAFIIPSPGAGRMLLLTLACPSVTGWSSHQALFAQIVTSATHPPRAVVPPDDESFENQTFRLA